MQRWLEVRQCGFQHGSLQFDYLRLVLVGVLCRVLLAAAKVFCSQVSLPDMLVRDVGKCDRKQAADHCISRQGPANDLGADLCWQQGDAPRQPPQQQQWQQHQLLLDGIMEGHLHDRGQMFA